MPYKDGGGLTSSGYLKSFEGPVLQRRLSTTHRECYLNKLVNDEIRNNASAIFQNFLFSRCKIELVLVAVKIHEPQRYLWKCGEWKVFEVTLKIPEVTGSGSGVCVYVCVCVCVCVCVMSLCRCVQGAAGMHDVSAILWLKWGHGEHARSHALAPISRPHALLPSGLIQYYLKASYARPHTLVA